jgi:hypothetical protein
VIRIRITASISPAAPDVRAMRLNGSRWRRSSSR